MAKSIFGLNKTEINKRIKEGRGLGSKSDYKPWIYVHEVPSAGRAQRAYSHLTNRVHHVLSDIEFGVLLLLDHNPIVTDIREQFPLNLQDTLKIAKAHKLWHPTLNKTPQVMSSDYLVNTTSTSMPLFALQVKSAEDLNDPRTIEKLEIERRYWKSKEIPWFIITEKEIKKEMKSNIEWLYGVKGFFDDIDVESLSAEVVLMKSYFESNPNRKIIDILKEYDAAYQLKLGESLYIFRQLCAARLIEFNIEKRIHLMTAKEVHFMVRHRHKGLQHVAS